MFNNTALDVFIGLTLIYLLYSLMATTVQEIIAQWFGLRNRMLQKAIRRMLMDEGQIRVIPDTPERQTFRKSKGFRPWVLRFWSGAFKRLKLLSFLRAILLNIVRFFYPWFLDRESFTKAFFEAPSIKYLGESSWHSRPSYIDAPTFSQTIVYLLRGENPTPTSNQMELIRNTLYNTGTKNNNGAEFTIHKETLQTLRNYYADSTGDVEKFKVNLEGWFQETMLRATGWYKKQTQAILFLVGFFIAMQFNVNSIQIYKILSTDKAAREQMVNLAIQTKGQLDNIMKQQAAAAAAKPGTTPPSDSILVATYNKLQAEAAKSQDILGTGPTSKKYALQSLVPKKRQEDFGSLLGWLITAIAISLGAPFWFDLLNKFMSLRSTGPKPASSGKAGKSNSANNAIKKVG